MNDKRWIIATAPGKERECYRVNEQDVEGYVNSLRKDGFSKFYVAADSYVIDDEDRKERD